LLGEIDVYESESHETGVKPLDSSKVYSKPIAFHCDHLDMMIYQKIPRIPSSYLF